MGATRPTGAEGAFNIQTERDGDVMVLTASGEIDLSVAEDFGDELRRALSSGALSVVLDLQQVSFLDSTGLGVLLAAVEESSTNGHKLRIMRPLSPAVEQMLEVTGLIDSLPWT
jgi:anti-sigma B factor antagonist